MAAFCTNCGAQVNGPFCGACGNRVENVTPPAPAPVAPKRSGLAKPLLIIGGIVFTLFALTVGGAIYGVYKVKHRLDAYRGGGLSSRAIHANVGGKACALLPRDELQQVLGVPIERTAEIMEGNDPGCAYYTNPEAFAQLRQQAIEEARKEAASAERQPAPKTDNPLELLKHTKEMEGIVKTLTLSEADKDGKVFSFSIDQRFRRENWSTLRGALTIVPGFDDVSGVGDRAMVGSFGHALYVLKGDSMVHLDLVSVPDSRNRGAEIGRRIVGRM